MTSNATNRANPEAASDHDRASGDSAGTQCAALGQDRDLERQARGVILNAYLTPEQADHFLKFCDCPMHDEERRLLQERASDRDYKIPGEQLVEKHIWQRWAGVFARLAGLRSA